jgi:preprotein translocase SecE subunit
MAEIRSDGGAARRARRAERNRSAVARREPQRPAVQEERKKRSNFVAESWAELKKVEWPTQNQVIQGTVVVLIACIVVGVFLYINDTVWKHVVSKVLLGQ